VTHGRDVKNLDKRRVMFFLTPHPPVYNSCNRFS